MKILAKCPYCKKKKLAIFKRTILATPLKIRMTSVNEMCKKCSLSFNKVK